MGYYTRINGSVVVEGGLIPKNILMDYSWTADGDGYFALQSETQGDTVDIVNGTITVVPGLKKQEFDFRWVEEGKYYDIDEHCALLAQAARAAGATIHGEIRGAGEETADVWRIVFDGTTATRETPKLLWPDGTTEELRR